MLKSITVGSQIIGIFETYTGSRKFVSVSSPLRVPVFLPIPHCALSQCLFICAHLFDSYQTEKAIWVPLLVCMSLFFTCLILIFLSFFWELLVHVCCGLGALVAAWTEKSTWTGVIGWRSQALWFMSKNRIQRTARPPRDKNWSVCFLLSSPLSCFSLHTEFPLSLFSRGLFSLP